MKSRLLTLGFFSLLTSASALAVPAWPGLRTYTQPDGTKVEYRVIGDEHGHAMMAPDGRLMEFQGDWLTYSDDNGYTDAVEYIEKTRKPQRILEAGGFPTEGEIHGLILLVDFLNAEMQPENTPELFNDVMNLEGWDFNGATGSARDYFVAQSNGRFLPTFDVYGPVKLEHNYGFYGANKGNGEDSGGATMIIDACNYAAENLGVDFSKYDYDDNGEVDFVYVIYAGYGENYGASANTIWPHASTLDAWYQQLSLHGKKINRYACGPELKYASGTTLEGIGTFCHEFSHVLGLPDLYNTYNSSYPQLGPWDVMDQGSYNNESHTPPSYSSYERYSLGWLEYDVLEDPEYDVILPELTSSNKAYLIPTEHENEFFTLENRQQCGWDAYHPGTGMMILHVDYDASAWSNNSVNAGLLSRVNLVEADGTQGYGEASDLFPGTLNVTTFASYTYPAMVQNDGTPVDRGLNHITELENGDISFDYRHDRLAIPENIIAEEIRMDGFTMQWEPVENAIGYDMKVLEIVPDDEKKVLLHETFEGMVKGEYPKSDYIDISESLDEHTIIPGWSGQDLYECGGLVRIGSYGVSGELTSPLISTLGNTDMTVAVLGCSYTGKKVNFTLELLDASGYPLASESFNAPKAAATYMISASGINAENVRARITTDCERFFADELRIMASADVSEETIWEEEGTKLYFEALEAPTCNVEDIKCDRSYRVSVRSLAEEEGMCSPWSDEVVITTLSESGIRNLNEAGYDLLSATEDGFAVKRTDTGYLLTVTDATGRILLQARPDHEGRYTLPDSGLFLIKYGPAILKVLK